MTNPDQLSANASRNKMNQIIEDAEVLLLNIADYEPSDGKTKAPCTKTQRSPFSPSL